MHNMKRITIMMVAAMSAFGFGQLTGLDHPTLKGNNARTGVNGDVAGSSPGYLSVANSTGTIQSALRWFLPLQSYTPVTSLRLNEINPFKAIIDNSDRGLGSNLDEGGAEQGPFDPLPNGIAGPVRNVWSTPGADEAAPNTYSIAVRRNVNSANAVPYQSRNFNPRFPLYHYSRTTSAAANTGQDPRTAQSRSRLASYGWTFTPKYSVFNSGTGVFDVFNDSAVKAYGIYAWIPIGPTEIGGTLVYPQRYWAYEITYGIGQKYVDIVDTYASGGGWVRLGNGGKPTNQMFPSGGLDGSGNPYPIKVTLFNTIPRDAKDQLLESVDATKPDNRFVVYADAVMFSTESDAGVATPTSAGFGSTDVRVLYSQNENIIDSVTMPPVSGSFTAKPKTISKGVLSSLDYNFGSRKWRYSPLEDGPDTVTISIDNTNPKIIPGVLTVPETDHPNQRGTSYLSTSVVGATATDNTVVNPEADVPDGGYELYTYVGGDNSLLPAKQFAHAAKYTVTENGQAYDFTIDLRGERVDQNGVISYRPGWVRLGDRRYSHSQANRLTISFKNASDDPTDLGRKTYVDELRFVGAVGTDIKSTPVHCRALVRETPTGTPVEKNLVILADERGRLHCLDADGRGDGTAKVYWTYPSTLPANLDPNLSPGRDANDPSGQKFDGENDTLSATMATDYDMSTAVVQRLSVPGPGGITIQRDFLFIGTKNGRVNCISMEGRGDAGTTTPGTTYRRWTYPETFPSPRATTSKLGAITSIVHGTVVFRSRPKDIIYVGTEQGRVYALDANGKFSFDTPSDLDTTIIWQYPPANSPTLNQIVGAPTLDAANNRLYFATTKDDDQGSGVYAVDARTGSLVWSRTADDTAPAADQAEFLDFRGGGAYVPASVLNVLPGTAMPNTFYIQNDNGFVYALNANTGEVLWRTSELLAGGSGSIIFSQIKTFDASGVIVDKPVIFVTTESGKFAALFARLGDETRFGNRAAWGYNMDASIGSTMTVSNKWLYGTTSNGYLFAWSDPINPGGVLPPGFIPPGEEVITDNNQDPLVEEFRNARVAFLSPEGFRRLRRTNPGGVTGLFNFSDVLDTAAYTTPNGNLKAPYRSIRSSNVYEWGETIYVMVYNFPVKLQNTNTPADDVPPPIVEAIVTTEGRAARPVASESRLFLDKDSTNADGGYAVFAIPLTSGGGTSQTPGPGRIQIQIRTSATNRSNTQQTITLNPATSRLTYRVANPIGISVENVFGSNVAEQLGYTVDGSRRDALVNGSPDINSDPVLGTVKGSLFGKSVGTGSHGASRKTVVNVFDRSLITLQRGEGRGLDLVRMDRRDLRWQGGAAAVMKAFANVPGIGSLLSAFEDLPTNFPNVSLDYPDLPREQVRVRKDPNGNVENPVFNSVTLKGPTVAGGGPVTDTNAMSRTIVPTPFELQVDVPKYQPSNLGTSSIPNQSSTFWQAGYAGRFTVYVDSDGNGNFTGGGQREAYRSFNLASAVSPDQKIVIGNPNIDLGSLAGGVGYDSRLTYGSVRPYRTLSPATYFNPYFDPSNPTNPGYSTLFKPVQIFNEGNVNLWNVRLAKGTLDLTSGLYWPWQILSQNNRDEVWLDGATDLHSDIDARFAPFINSTNNNIIVQKPRVGDTAGRQLRVNPTSRLNPNIPNSGTQLLPPLGGIDSLNRDARVAVSIPFGTPVGRYSQLMRVIEDTGVTGLGSGTGALDESISLGYSASGTAVPQEAFSDPTFTLTFNVKETRLTGGKSDFTDAVIHEGNAITPTAPAQWMDVQPSGMRRTNGDLMFAFASNRPSLTPVVGNPSPSLRNTRIFVGRIRGAPMGGVDPARGVDSSLRDLNQFVPADPANQRWWQGQAVLPVTSSANIFTNTLTNGLPSPVSLGGSIVPGTESYGHPAFSTVGDKGLTGALNRFFLVAYVANAKRQTANGVVDDSRIVVSRVNFDGTTGSEFALDADPTLLKGRPTLIQDGGIAYIMYSAESNGTSANYFVVFDTRTGFGQPVQLGFGSGFESVSSPSAIARRKLDGSTEINMAFTGRLRGSGVSELFLSRLQVGGPQGWQFVTFGNASILNGSLVDNMTYDARLGGYRARGAAWAGDFAVTLADGTPVVSGPAVTDRQTLIKTYPTIFGGNMVVDSNLGVVRFTQATLPKNLQLVVTYTPLFIRVSGTTVAGYSTPSLIFDPRVEPSNTSTTYAFWKTPSGANQPANSSTTFSHRFMLSSIRSAAAGGQTGRPVMSTFRFGIRLGRALKVNPDGSLGETLIISGNVGAYQIDPVAGRIYFTADDEDRIIRLGFNGQRTQKMVTIIGESPEDFVPMDTAVNESNFNLFLDVAGFPATRRGMVWGLWSSTRDGSPNLFMQSMARKITPFLPPQ